MLNLHLLECTVKGYDHISYLLLAKCWLITGCKYYQCTSLKYIYIKPTTPPTLPISSNAFSTGSSVTIYVPNSALSKYRSAWSQQYGKSVQGYDFPE